jgi:aminoglycoside phosphotransferase (APT) family kinase protein
MSGFLDAPRAVRPGEEIDAAALLAWLTPQVPGLRGPITVEQFPSGHSNLTYLLRDEAGRELVLRRPPRGSAVKTAHDMGREHRILSRLWQSYPLAPRALAFTDDASVIGAPFYVMERVRGVVLRGARPPRGLEIAPATMRRISESLVRELARLHAVDADAAGLGDLGRPEGYVLRQVRGWCERYATARTDALPEVERAMAWLAAHAPAESGAALIHNDWKYDNLVLDPADLAEVRAVLDWEMATIGDPLMDLGTSLGYWVDPDDAADVRALPFGPTAFEGNLTRREVWERYAAAAGRAPADPLFYYVYGLVKVIGIAQQIYLRWTKGLTRDERFGALILAVAALGRQAARAIDRGRIDRLGE